MKIYVPYTNVQVGTRVILAPYDHELVLMEHGDSYPEYLAERWRSGESFINCEHDVIFWHGAIEELERCPNQWCAFGLQDPSGEQGAYTVFGHGAAPTFNLVKFADKFIARYPDVWTDLLNDPPYNIQPQSRQKWEYCDWWLINYVATRWNDVCHQHFPPVANANPVSQSISITVAPVGASSVASNTTGVKKQW